MIDGIRITNTRANGSREPADSACIRSSATPTDAPRDFDWRSLRKRRRRRDVQGIEPGRRRGVCARSVSRVRAVRSQDRRTQGRTRPAVHAKPWWLGRMDGPGGRRPDIGVAAQRRPRRTWRSIAKGLPSDFGFPMVVHPHDPDTVYVMPHEPSTRHAPAARRPYGGARTAAVGMEAAGRGNAEEGELLHRPARRDGHRPAEIAGACISAPRPASSGWAETAGRTGSASSIRCHRFTM